MGPRGSEERGPYFFSSVVVGKLNYRNVRTLPSLGVTNPIGCVCLR